MGFTALHGLAAKGMTGEIQKLFDHDWIFVSRTLLIAIFLPQPADFHFYIFRTVYSSTVRSLCFPLTP
jgi:hypothetical protein